MPGSLVIAGNLQLTPTSVLDTTLGLGLDRAFAGTLEVRGTTTLDGSLKVSKGSGFTPVSGQQFPIAVFAKAPSGGFAQQDDAALGATVKAETALSTQALRVNLVPR